MIHDILNNYAQFLNLNNFKEAVCTPQGLTGIILLFGMEALLSADNALVLAMMVEHLPKEKQKKALTYGIWGAYIFRFLIIGIGTYLIKFSWVKALGALYLLHMAYKGLTTKEDDETGKAVNKGLFMTVLTVEAMDIVFSIDSVTAALAISDKVWIVFLGAVFGILAMRFVANKFVDLIEKIPELKKTAYILIAIIGTKLAVAVFGIEVPDLPFFILLIGVFLSTFVIHKLKPTTT